MSLSTIMPHDLGQWKITTTNPGRTTNGPDPSGIKVWVTPIGKIHNQLRFSPKAKEIKNSESYNHVASYKNEDYYCHEFEYLLLILLYVCSRHTMICVCVCVILQNVMYLCAKLIVGRLMKVNFMCQVHWTMVFSDIFKHYSKCVCEDVSG